MNARLPRDIICFRAEDVPPDFDAKASAKKKCYTYYIQNSPFPDVFRQGYAWNYPHPLKLTAIQEAAAAFLGTHDFIGFASAGFTVKTTVRTIYSLDIQKSGDIISINVTGNGFLYNMVRIIAGTLVFAGAGKLNPADMPDIIRSGDRYPRRDHSPGMRFVSITGLLRISDFFHAAPCGRNGEYHEKESH